MILKIERYLNGKEWALIDNIRRVTLHKTYGINTKDDLDQIRLLSDTSDAIYIENSPCLCFIYKNDKCEKCGDAVDESTYRKEYRVGFLELRLEDNSIQMITFDSVAYLLNDSGKTIERIVVNYPAYKKDGSRR